MAAPRSVGDTDRVMLWKNLQSCKEDNRKLRARVEELERELEYAYLVVDFGFNRGCFDFTVLRNRAAEWVRRNDE